jgi:hypothetical protein
MLAMLGGCCLGGTPETSSSVPRSASSIIQPPKSPRPPVTRLGAYEVVSLLGADGMGEVYRASDSKLNA